MVFLLTTSVRRSRALRDLFTPGSFFSTINSHTYIDFFVWVFITVSKDGDLQITYETMFHHCEICGGAANPALAHLHGLTRHLCWSCSQPYIAKSQEDAERHRRRYQLERQVERAEAQVRKRNVLAAA